MFYYLELDNREPGFEAAWESSAFAYASDEIQKITAKLGIKSVFNLMSTKEYDHLMPPGYEEAVVPWFDAQEGIDWLDALTGYIRTNPSSVGKSAKLLDDLDRCRGILVQGKGIGAKWHFGMDI